MRINITGPKPEGITFSVGDVLLLDDETYMISASGGGASLLVSLDNGHIWTKQKMMPKEDITVSELLNYVGEGVSVYLTEDVCMSLTRGAKLP